MCRRYSASWACVRAKLKSHRANNYKQTRLPAESSSKEKKNRITLKYSIIKIHFEKNISVYMGASTKARQKWYMEFSDGTFFCFFHLLPPNEYFVHKSEHANVYNGSMQVMEAHTTNSNFNKMIFFAFFVAPERLGTVWKLLIAFWVRLLVFDSLSFSCVSFESKPPTVYEFTVYFMRLWKLNHISTIEWLESY